MDIIDYSVVIPVYKSQKSLPILAKRLEDFFSFVAQNQKYEIIFINDSPCDKETGQILEWVLKNHRNVRVIELTKNFGQQSATLCGIFHSCGKFIITMDDDMQHDPYDIQRLMQMQCHDIVIAKFKNKKHSLARRCVSYIKGYFDYIVIGKPKHIQLTSFRLFSRVIADNMMKINTSFPFIPALLFSVSDDIVNVEMEHYARIEGKSHYSIGRLILLFKNLLINNSSLLLNIIGKMGLFFACSSLLYALGIIFKKIYWGIPYHGYSSIMVAILFLGGMIMLALGVIGEYLIRIIHTSESRPHYFVRKILDD
jgi:dolichol-phosphate mannosyltransferase/undecaprenyl-phosphate 4-deoxy-4-formamido-L-arabinose transferase